MKKIFALTLVLLSLAIIPAGCAEKAPANSGGNVTQVENLNPPEPPENDGEPSDNKNGKILVAYFSATNITEGVATNLSELLNADLYEILPEVPYTSEDLNYNADCRANREQDDATARPAISGGVENIEDYDVIFLGYPIWWGQALRVISTFIESYDFSGKTIVPFCTSGSSGIGSSATNLHGLTDGANWLEGKRFSGGASQAEITNWLNGLEIAGGAK